MSLMKEIKEEVFSPNFVVRVPSLEFPILIPVKDVRSTIRSFEINEFPFSPPFMAGVTFHQGQLIKVLDLSVLFDVQVHGSSDGIVLEIGEEVIVLKNAYIDDDLEVKEVVSRLGLIPISGQEIIQEVLLVTDGEAKHHVFILDFASVLREVNESLTFRSGSVNEYKTLRLERLVNIVDEVELFKTPNIASSLKTDHPLDYNLYFSISGMTFSVPLEDVAFLIKDLKLVKMTDILHQFALGFIYTHQQYIIIFDPKFMIDPSIPTVQYSKAVVLYNPTEKMYYGFAVDSIEDIGEIEGDIVVSREVYPSIYQGSDYIIEKISWENNSPTFHISPKRLFQQLLRGKVKEINWDNIFISEKKILEKRKDEKYEDTSYDFLIQLNGLVVSLPRDNIISMLRDQEQFGDESKWIIYRNSLVPIIDVLQDIFDYGVEESGILLFDTGGVQIGIPFPIEMSYGTINWETITSFQVSQIIDHFAGDFMSIVEIIGFGRVEGRERGPIPAVKIDNEALINYLSNHNKYFDSTKISDQEMRKARAHDQYVGLDSSSDISGENILLFEIKDQTYGIPLNFVSRISRINEDHPSIENLLDHVYIEINPVTVELGRGEDMKLLNLGNFKGIGSYDQDEIQESSNPMIQGVVSKEDPVYLLDIEKIKGELSNE